MRNWNKRLFIDNIANSNRKHPRVTYLHYGKVTRESYRNKGGNLTF